MTRNHGRRGRHRRMRQQKNLISQMGGGSQQPRREAPAPARVTGSCTFIRDAADVHSIPEMKTARTAGQRSGPRVARIAFTQPFLQNHTLFEVHGKKVDFSRFE